MLHKVYEMGPKLNALMAPKLAPKNPKYQARSRSIYTTGIHISQEIFAIDMLRALQPSLEHDRKHVLGLLRLGGDKI